LLASASQKGTVVRVHAMPSAATTHSLRWVCGGLECVCGWVWVLVWGWVCCGVLLVGCGRGFNVGLGLLLLLLLLLLLWGASDAW